MLEGRGGGIQRESCEGGPSTTSPVFPAPSAFRGNEEFLCNVFSGLERVEDDEEDEVEEVVEEDSVQAGRWTAGSSIARETLNRPN